MATKRSYSAKAARKGKDIGKSGKNFKSLGVEAYDCAFVSTLGPLGLSATHPQHGPSNMLRSSACR